MNRTQREKRLRHKCRRAVVSVLIIVVLLLMSAMVGEFIRRAVAERRQLRQELLLRQTEQLAHAGLQLARQEVRKDPGYAGEIWEIPVGQIHQTNSGTVEIHVDRDVATVVARYPGNSENPVQVTRTVRLTP